MEAPSILDIFSNILTNIRQIVLGMEGSEKKMLSSYFKLKNILLRHLGDEHQIE